jgi:RRXRR protein
MFVPVVDQQQQPLMPTTPARARRWIQSSKATPFWKRGVFCVRLNVEPSARVVQPVTVGIDPGSKKEGFSVISAAHTYLNLQADAVDWVKAAVRQRRQMRRTRRGRKTPCRQPRANRLRNTKKLPPSTKARWQWKLRLCRWLLFLYPITAFVVEDIKAQTTGKRRWDRSFSPLEAGKQWFYAELARLAPVQTRQGWETKRLREQLGLKKTGKKTEDVWRAQVPGQYPPAVRDALAVAPPPVTPTRSSQRREPPALRRDPELGSQAGHAGQTPSLRTGLCRGKHGRETQPACAPERQAAHPGSEAGGLSPDQTPPLEGAAPPNLLEGDGSPPRGY